MEQLASRSFSLIICMVECFSLNVKQFGFISTGAFTLELHWLLERDESRRDLLLTTIKCCSKMQTDSEY